MGTKKTLAFQFATEHKVYENSDLISKKQAITYWTMYLPKFIELREKGENPQMAIWLNMDERWMYGKTLCMADEDTIVKHGKLYNLTEIKP